MELIGAILNAIEGLLQLISSAAEVGGCIGVVIALVSVAVLVIIMIMIFG